MNACEEMRELLGGHLDGELSVEDRARLDEHLAGCEACRRELAETARVWEALGVLEGIAPAADLAERVYRRVLTTRRVESVWRRSWFYPLATAATLLVALTVGYYLTPPATVSKVEPTQATGDLPALTGETAEIVRNLDLLEELDVLENLDAIAEMGSSVILIPENGSSDTPGGGES
ncbi:MAG TPA: zf-HC2 domain-containing protein [Planctomycetota bacterium]|nr:zf-HC2 domain-containing protein [Planctomycetota bacterium]